MSDNRQIDVRTPRTISALISSREADFRQILPRHVSVETFMGLAAAYVRRDDRLREAAAANPGSLMIALRECAALGHVPMKGTYSLVAYGREITGIEEVRGTIQRMYRAGGIQSIHVQIVHERDRFRWSPAMELPDHQFDPLAPTADRGPMVGVYAWARFSTGGISQVVLLNRDQVMRYAAMAKTRKFWEGPWEPEMWQKTALHRLEKFVPTSAEYLWNRAAAEAGSARSFPDLPDAPAVDFGDATEVVQGEVVAPRSGPDDDWPATTEPGGPR